MLVLVVIFKLITMLPQESGSPPGNNQNHLEGWFGLVYFQNRFQDTTPEPKSLVVDSRKSEFFRFWGNVRQPEECLAITEAGPPQRVGA